MSVQIAVPANVQDYQAAQFLVNPVTAYAFLEAIAVPEGEWLLQNAANSVLGKEVGVSVSECSQSSSCRRGGVTLEVESQIMLPAPALACKQLWLHKVLWTRQVKPYLNALGL